MPILSIRRGAAITEYSFTGAPTLAEALAAAGFAQAQPCGGRGTCGKCTVEMLCGEVFPPNEAEKRVGVRLACQARLRGDCAVTLPAPRLWTGIETEAAAPEVGEPMPGRYGAAVDLGTTTIVAQVYELATGRALGRAALPNPQAAVAADVMGRVSAALSGELARLSTLARTAVHNAVKDACLAAGVGGVEALSVAGNTVMLTLLTGRDPRTLAVSPFKADCLFGFEEPLFGVPAYLPPCGAAFIGADITCAALATGLADAGDTSLLMDIGTNGELVLSHQSRLFAVSASAGPAFEGVEISQGMGCAQGAIDKVWVESGGLGARVVGGGKAVGLCGSGLVDAIAALLRLGRIDPDGRTDAPRLLIRDGVSITAADVRAVQLAKAAIAAGVETLLAAAGLSAGDVQRLALAGGFGSRLNVASAAAIGLIPAALAGKTYAAGNAALAGAAALLTDMRLRGKAEAFARTVEVLPLGGDPAFEKRFFANMDFPRHGGGYN